MKKTPPPKNARKPVADVVHQIMENARTARADGPSSPLYGRNAQLSSAITQAGTLLAKLDHAAPPKRSSLLQNLWGTPQAEKPARTRWFFFGASKQAAAMPDAKRIEQLLRGAEKEGRRLVLDRDPSEDQQASDLDCTLPEGAVDPVCTPR
jgi:hypothetical protein